MVDGDLLQGSPLYHAEGTLPGRLRFWDLTTIIIKFLSYRRKFRIFCLYFKTDLDFARPLITTDHEPDHNAPSHSNLRMQPLPASVTAQPVVSRDAAEFFEPASSHNELHPQWHVRCVMLLVAFLHTRHHVSFKACGLIILCLNFIFSALPGRLIGPRPMPPLYRPFFPASA
jgi:hypothetical protein